MEISKKDAEKVLAPYKSQISKIFEQAISEFKTDPRKLFYCERTKACIISDLIQKYVKIELSGQNEIRFRKKYGCNYIIIRDKFVIKFKKFDNNLRTSNIQTRQVNRFIYQRALWEDNELPPPMTNIFAGYTWDSLHNDYTGIFITCPQGKGNKWFLNIGLSEPIAEVLPFRSPDANTNNRRRAKPRKADQDEKANNDQK